MRKYLSRNKKYYFYEAVFMIGWLTFFLVYQKTYQELVFYVNKEATFLVQLLFISNSYLNELITSLLSYFVLLTVNLEVLLMYYVGNRQAVATRNGWNKFLSGVLSITSIFAIMPLFTLAWPFFLLVLIASLTVIYITYAITRHLYEDSDVFIHEEDEAIKVLGPFQTIEERECNTAEFISYWNEPYKKCGLKVVAHNSSDEKNDYYVEFTVQQENRKENI